MQRFGQVIGLRPEQIAAYEALHAAIWPEVLAMIQSCHIHNYTIFRQGTTLFAYFEYTGVGFAADMARMAAAPKTHDWWALTAPLQQPLPERGQGEWWHTLPIMIEVLLCLV